MTATLMQLPHLLTEREAAAALGISIDTLRRERRRGRIDYVKIGARVRHTEKHLVDYIENGTVRCHKSQIDPSRIGDHWLSRRPKSAQWCRTWFDRATRQTRRASLGTADFDEATKRLAEWVTTNGKMQRERPENVYLETVLARYYGRHAVHLASAEAARYALKKWSDHFAGALVSEATADRQRQFAAAMRSQGASDGYIRRTLAVGKAALNWALREGEIMAAPTVALGIAPEGEPRERLLSIAEAAALFRAAESDHLLLYLLLAFGTAARPAAILELTTFQVDCDARLIRLNPPGRAQNKKRRPTLPMCNTLLPYLRALPAGPIVSYHGRALKSIKTPFERARVRAGLSKDVTPYTIRHTVAAEMRRRGVPVWEVAGWLGHTSGYKKTERYAKLGPDHLSGAVRAIDAFFGELSDCLPAVFLRTLPDIIQLRATEPWRPWWSQPGSNR